MALFSVETVEGWVEHDAVLATCGVPVELWMAVTLGLGGLTDYSELAMIPPLYFKTALNVAILQGSPVKPIEAARFTRLWRSVRRHAGEFFENPMEVAAPPRPRCGAARKGGPPLAAAPPAKKVKLSVVSDQHNEEEVAVASKAQLTAWRKTFLDTQGAYPVPQEETSPEQDTALWLKLARDEPPYVDFAVWVPFHGILANFLKMAIEQHFADGSVLRTSIEGPPKFQSMEAVF